MAAFGKKLRTVENGYIYFFCPACERAHVIGVSNDKGPIWSFNNNGDAPTFNPSILVNANGTNPNVPICHSFVRNGFIQYLGDCTHSMAGKTVELPDLNEPVLLEY